MSGISINKQLESLQRTRQLLEAKENILLNKALSSTHPSDLLKANQIITNVQEREKSQKKSYLLDPLAFTNSFGYKDKPYSMSYEMLKKISFAVPIIRAIIGTRVDQVASFTEPQFDKYSTGFIIRKKQQYYKSGTDKPSKEEITIANQITDFILNCGIGGSYESDDFDTFVRKIINDSLTYDQMTFEVINDRRGRPYEFVAVDASTIRIADSYDDDEYNSSLKQQIKGYYPSYCQVLQGQVTSDFYPWELSFGIRNPVTNIYSNGYGVSEIEMLVNTITSMLWSDEYNRRFFSQGSAPKGFFKVKGATTSLNNSTVSQFKQQWNGMMAGVYNSWKTPVLEGDIDWVSLHQSNQDMEFSKWQEYLIKLSSAIYRIDPAEINFPLSGGSEQRAMFEGNNEARLKHSKDKGLYPILKFLQRRINKSIVSRINPEYEFVFVGMDGADKTSELEADVKMMTNFMTIDEIRIKRGLKPLGEENGGNVIANSIWYQQNQAKQQQEQMAQQQGGEQQDYQGEDVNQDDDEEYDDNPFEKAFNNYLKGLN